MIRNNLENKPVVFLDNSEEAVGKVTGIEKQQNQMLISISVERKIYVPLKSFTKQNLNDFIGEKIGILKTDNEFYIRKIEKSLIRRG